MKTIKSKLLWFYGGTLGFVIVLFQGITHYGNTKLAAAPNINGRYLSTAAMPGCPESSRVLLTLLQSGVYLNGAIDLVENTAVIEESTSESTPPLSGQLAQQQVTLDGSTAALSSCQPATQQVQVIGTVAVDADKKLAFTGTVSLDNNVQPWQIKALRLVETTQEKGH